MLVRRATVMAGAIVGCLLTPFLQPALAENTCLTNNSNAA
jgi:hypothetical protein